MRPYFCQCKDASSLGRQNEFLNGRQFNDLLADAKFHVTYVVYSYICVFTIKERPALDILSHILSLGFMIMAQKWRELGRKCFEECFEE